MKIKNIILSLLLCSSVGSFAQNCEFPVYVHLDEEFTNVPSAATAVLRNSMNRIVTAGGMSTDAAESPFIITVRCDVLDKSNLPGPPIQVVQNIGMTLYFADTYNKTKFSTAYIELKGVGSNDNKSYINAMRRINGNNAEIASLIETGKKSMLKYYETQHKNIMSQARRLVGMQKYEQAINLLLAIPVCAKGADEATKYGLEIYSKHLDRLNLYLFNKANAVWASGGDTDAAKEACMLLSQIDPDARCYSDAQKLITEIKKQVRSDIDFEMRQKYNDSVSLEEQRIEAARAVGVAWGKGQQPSTTNIAWLR